MDKIGTFSLLMLIFLTLCGANAMAQTAGIMVGTASGLPGATVTVPVTFAAGATPVSTMQFDLMFSPSIVYGSTIEQPQSRHRKHRQPIAGGAILIFGLNTNAITRPIATVQSTISGGAPPATSRSRLQARCFRSQCIARFTNEPPYTYRFGACRYNAPGNHWRSSSGITSTGATIA
jgi:hypothetical protein